MDRTRALSAARLMGLIIAVVIAGMTWLGLRRSRKLPPAALQLAGAAMLIGLAGYTLQGRAGLVGSPQSQQALRQLPPVLPVDVATAFFGRFNGAYSWLVIANSYMVRGDSGNAVGAIESGLRARPRDAELWIGLGNAMTIHAEGRITPAAQLAFERAVEMAPVHPGPPFFYGTALLQQGDVDAGLAMWKRALSLTPANAAWRDGLAARIVLIERMKAEPLSRPRPTFRSLPDRKPSTLR